MEQGARPFESYVSSMVALTLAALMAYFALDSGSWTFAIVACALFLVGLKRRDYRSPLRWWISLVLYGSSLAFLLLLKLLPGPPLEAFSSVWILWIGVVACMAAEVLLLILGRLRHSWKFTRAPD